MLPAELKARAQRLARSQWISLGELVRRSLEQAIERRSGLSAQPDSLMEDRAVYEGKVPEDLAGHHDRYLFGR